MNKNRALHWPIGITLSIIGVAGLCIWTIKIAQGFPVEIDSSYFADYIDVDTNINEIIMVQKEFDNKYNLQIEKNNFKIGENSIKIEITDKQNNAINNANIEIVITRPQTAKYDKKLTMISRADGIYQFEPFDVKKVGRWQIQSKTTLNNLISYDKIEVNATN